ncbi:MAG: hypothetical protein IKN33_03410 [Selenomonadaceae bacterium]|nr:hypothetical protein [Selenomonadaceae bacterium]
MNNNYDPIKAAKAQEAYCDQHECPMFAPRDGRCYRCGYNIFLPFNASHGAVLGITVEEAGKKLITGCPICNYSYVE